ncbi:MAG: DUF234 domain-containing protein [Lachnospiraceae bacterium]|nr:DUF234 domain-containing protein [Lachnospiraceae bacterium]
MIVRTSQIRSLNENYGAQGNSILLLYGRDGCEKEGMLRIYLQDKKHFYYRARQASAQEQYRQMAAEVEQTYDVKLQKGTYNEIFNRIKSGDATKLVVVIDEFQYLVKKAPEFMDSLIKLRDKRLYPGPVQIILASSDVAWVEQELAECLGERVKKIKETIKLQDLTFLDLVRAYPENTVSEVVQIYGVIGGVSSYVSRWNPKVDVRTNICRNVLSPYGWLHHEAERYISLRLRELAVYETILSAIAAGNRKLNDLYHLTGFSRAKISVYLRNLMEMDVIEKADSFETGGDRNTQKGLYQIRDHYINFWFRFIYPHLSDLYLLKPEEFYDRYIAPDIDEYMNRYFVQVCMEYMELMNRVGKLPLQVTKLGTWIGKQGTVDIVAQDAVRNTLVGSCNWSKPMMTAADVEGLEQTLKKARLSPKHIFLFTATEFAPELVELAGKDERFILVDMKEL